MASHSYGTFPCCCIACIRTTCCCALDTLCTHIARIPLWHCCRCCCVCGHRDCHWQREWSVRTMTVAWEWTGFALHANAVNLNICDIDEWVWDLLAMWAVAVLVAEDEEHDDEYYGEWLHSSISAWMLYSDFDLVDSFEFASVEMKWRTMMTVNEKIPAQFTKYANFSSIFIYVMCFVVKFCFGDAFLAGMMRRFFGA